MYSKDESALTVSVVINTNYGGFSLSRAGAEAVLKRKGIAYRLEASHSDGRVYPYIGEGWQTAMDACIGRHDPDLIAVIRELGADVAGSVDFTISVDISSDDGMETASIYGVRT
jgi:hypothetical protein